jgi:hypothetical protein
MKKNTFKTSLLAVGIVTLGLTACKKETLTPNSKTKPKGEINSTKNKVYQEGIVSHNGFDASGDITTGYYEFFGPFPGQYANGVYPAGTSTLTLKGCAATTGNIMYVYKVGTYQVLDGTFITSTVILNPSGTAFTPAIEEIEIHPQTGEVYALVTQGTAKRIYAIDPSTGFVTPLTVNGSATTIFNASLMNGYKCGSIAFVPDGFGNYEFVFSHESDVYASLGVVSWHFNIFGTNLVSNVPNHRTYAGIPGTVGSGINTTYGNGKLYFSRHGSSNPVYSLSLTSNTFASEGFSVTNNNDFGYWKAF